VTSITGSTALMEASYKSHLEIVCSLLEYNADVIAKTDGRDQYRTGKREVSGVHMLVLLLILLLLLL